MARTTEIPQRRLALELRIAIDEAMRSHREDARSRVAELIAANPVGAVSSHVLHNLGLTRRGWLSREIPETWLFRAIEPDERAELDALLDA